MKPWTSSRWTDVTGRTCPLPYRLQSGNLFIIIGFKLRHWRQQTYDNVLKDVSIAVRRTRHCCDWKGKLCEWHDLHNIFLRNSSIKMQRNFFILHHQRHIKSILLSIVSSIWDRKRWEIRQNVSFIALEVPACHWVADDKKLSQKVHASMETMTFLSILMRRKVIGIGTSYFSNSPTVALCFLLKATL